VDSNFSYGNFSVEINLEDSSKQFHKLKDSQKCPGIVGYLENGSFHIYFLGRIKEQIIDILSFQKNRSVNSLLRDFISINNHFVIYIYDVKTKIGWGITDPVGIGKLYVCKFENVLLISTDINLILLRFPLKPSLQGMAMFIANCTMPSLSLRNEVFSDILRFSGGRGFINYGRTIEFFSSELYQKNKYSIISTQTEACEKFEEAIIESLKVQLSSNSSSSIPWLDVSGGLDSTLLAQYAQRLINAENYPAAVYTVDHSKSKDGQERGYKKLVQQHLGLHVYENDLDSDHDLVSDKVTEINCGYPSLDLIFSERQRKTAFFFKKNNGSIRIRGLGGDQIFGGDGIPPTYIRELFFKGNFKKWKNETLKWAIEYNNYDSKIISNSSFPWLEPPNIQMRSIPKWLVLNPPSRICRISKYFKGFGANSFYCLRKQSIRMIAQNSTICDSFRENRFPLLSPNVVNLSLKIAPSILMSPNIDRPIERALLKKTFPEIASRRNKGSSISSSREILKEYMAHNFDLNEIENWKISTIGLVTPDLLKANISDLLNDYRIFCFPQMMAAITMEAWLRRNKFEF
jgi:asparagine synthetase B (glutamine-hydrolysing)